MAIKNIRQIIKFPDGCKEITVPLWKTHIASSLVSANVVVAGVSDIVAGYEIQRTPVAENHIVVFTDEGSGVFIAGGRKYVLEKGSVFICPCNCAEHYFPAEGGFWRKFWFHLGDTGQWERLKRNGPELRQALNPGALLNAMRLLVAESLSSLPESTLVAKMYSDITAIYLKREMNSDLHPHDIRVQERLDSLWNKVNGDLNRTWTLTQLAKAASFSTAHLSRLCVEYYGFSPVKMLLRLRLQRTADLLGNSGMKLDEIASVVGYGNQFALSSAFSREYGMSPRAFRKSHR